MSANSTWEAILRAHATLLKRFAAEDIWGDLSMREYDVLYTLSKGESPMRLSELNRHVLLSQPAMSRLTERLVARGLICREPDSADRRGLRLSLSERGRALQREIGRRHARSVASAVGTALTGEEQRQLEALCRKLAAAAQKN
jgi:DNA-binding MarR family transcriptional regulator